MCLMHFTFRLYLYTYDHIINVLLLNKKKYTNKIIITYHISLTNIPFYFSFSLVEKDL